jgi:hypothetical protein
MSGSGDVDNLKINKSSGTPSSDQRAQDAIRNASPFRPLSVSKPLRFMIEFVNGTTKNDAQTKTQSEPVRSSLLNSL